MGMNINNYIIENLEERNAVMKEYATDPRTMKEFEEEILKCVEQGRIIILKLILENLWKQNLREEQIEIFMEQITKDGAHRIKHNINSHLSFYKEFFEMGFTPYIVKPKQQEMRRIY